MENELSQELLKREFMHALVNVLVCIGASPRFIETVKQTEEKPFTQQTVDEARQYGIDVYEELKNRFNGCYYYTIKNG